VNDFEHLLYRHRSIRTFKDTPISIPRLKELLKAAIHGTSSSGNLNSYSMILTTSPEQKQKLWKLHLEQDMILEAPCIITFLADFHRVRQWLKKSQARDGFNDYLSYSVAAFDTLLLSQSVALACEAEGWGICYMGTTLYIVEELQGLFDLPPTVVPVTSLVVGVPAEEPAARSRLPLEAYLHEERYHAYDNKRIEELYAERDADFVKRYATNLEILERCKQEGVQNLGQFYTSRLKYYPPHAWRYGEAQG
jgi:nitroreductase